MIKKVLSKSFMRPIVDSEDRYLMGTGEQRAYLYDQKMKELIKIFPFGAEGRFNKESNRILLSQRRGVFSIYDIKENVMLLTQKLPRGSSLDPASPCCFYSDNILLFETKKGREKQIMRYNIAENSFHVIHRSYWNYTLVGKMGDACICYYCEHIDNQIKIRLIKLNEEGEIASKIVDTDGFNTLLYKDNYYYIYQCQDNCYEIRCMNENFEECQIGYIKRKKSFFVDQLCLDEKYIAFICKNRGDYKTESLIVYDRINEKEIIEEKCPQFTMDLLLTKDTVYIGAMDALYCCELDRHSDDAN